MGRVALVLALLVAARPASAAPEGDRAAAKQHFETGSRLYTVAEYARARDEFKAAYLAQPLPAFLYNLGQCSRMLGEPEQALHFYRQYLRDLPTAQNRVAVEAFIVELENQLRLRSLRAPEPTPILAPAPAPAQPTAPTVVYMPTQVTTKIIERQAVAPAARPTPPWVWGVVGGSALVVALGVTLGLVLGLPNNAPDLREAPMGRIEFAR